MPVCHVGDIFTLGPAPAQYGVVIFARPVKWGTQQDLRIVPLYPAQENVCLATDHDLILPAAETPFGTETLAACWNARGMASWQLGQCIGHVHARVVQAIRTCEISRTIPEVDMTPWAAWQGPKHLEENSHRETCVSFQKAEVERWDALDTASGLAPNAHDGSPGTSGAS